MDDLLKFGSKFCQAILLQFAQEFSSSKRVSKEFEQNLYLQQRKIVEEFYSKKEHLIQGDPDSGSESEISDDELSNKALKSLLPKTKLKKRGYFLKKYF